DGNRFLVAVDRSEVAAECLQIIIGVVGSDDAGVIAVKRLDLDDLGALVGQQHGAEWPGQHLRQVDDADPVEGAERGSAGHGAVFPADAKGGEVAAKRTEGSRSLSRSP